MLSMTWIFVNNVKHRQPMVFVDKELYEQLRITCYGYMAQRGVAQGAAQVYTRILGEEGGEDSLMQGSPGMT